jgi:hypothetical protein
MILSFVKLVTAYLFAAWLYVTLDSSLRSMLPSCNEDHAAKCFSPVVEIV